MGALFERSNQTTAGSPRIGKGSPGERSQGCCYFVNVLPHGINCANKGVRLPALPNSGRATRGLCVLQRVQEGRDATWGEGRDLFLSKLAFHLFAQMTDADGLRALGAKNESRADVK